MANTFMDSVDSVISEVNGLHKFYNFNERNLEAISEPYLWFSPLDAFNDPFEGQVQFTSTEDLYSALRLQLGFLFDKQSDPPSSEEVTLRKLHHKNPQRFFMDFRDQCIQYYIDRTEHWRKQGHCCFLSERTANPAPSHTQEILMWSHYGNGLRGFRITYDINKLINSLPDVDVYFVNYVSEPETVDVTAFYSFRDNMSGPRYEYSHLSKSFISKHKA